MNGIRIGFQVSGSGFRVEQSPAPSVVRRDCGFTLIEVLVALSIVVIITGIVYESLVAVTDATETARLSAEEMRLRQFLTQSFTSNLSTVYTDPGLINSEFQFLGASEKGPNGSMDSVEFCSSAPLMGGIAPPGVLKRVHYGVATMSESNVGLESSGEDTNEGLASSTVTFEAVETPITTSAMSAPGSPDTGDTKKALAQAVQDAGIESPTWSAPIDALDISYYDGVKWVKEWDSTDLGRLPWCVRVRLNFAKTKAEVEAGARSNIEEDPDFELYVPIPISEGVLTDAATQWGDGSVLGPWYGWGGGASMAGSSGNLSGGTGTQSSGTIGGAQGVTGRVSTGLGSIGLNAGGRGRTP
jgi:prepilin-type N-terminal cleavage/methylation domain-containing protein